MRKREQTPNPLDPYNLSCRDLPACETLARWLQSCKRRLSGYLWQDGLGDVESQVQPIEGLETTEKLLK